MVSVCTKYLNRRTTVFKEAGKIAKQLAPAETEYGLWIHCQKDILISNLNSTGVCGLPYMFFEKCDLFLLDL